MIFLSILKIIEIVLLCIIALVLLIAILILIVPVRYVAAVKGKNKHINFIFEAKWLLGIVHYRYSYINGKDKSKVKVFNKKTKSKSKSKQSSNNIKLALSLFKFAGYKIIKHVFPKKIRGNLSFGFEDPALTALLYGLTTWLTEQSEKNDFVITPNFDETDIVIDFKIYGRLFVGYVVICLLRFFIKSKIESLRR